MTAPSFAPVPQDARNKFVDALLIDLEAIGELATRLSLEGGNFSAQKLHYDIAKLERLTNLCNQKVGVLVFLEGALGGRAGKGKEPS